MIRALILSFLLLVNTCAPVMAELSLPAETASLQSYAPSELEEKIEYYTVQILLKEIELERFYNQYRLFASKDPKYRYLRYFLLQQTAAGLTLGSYIGSCSELGRNLTTPDRISQQLNVRTTKAGLIGVYFQGGSSALELGSNIATTIKHKIKKMDPKSAAKNVRERLQIIDALSIQRNELIEKLSNKEGIELLKAEGRILKYFRDWCLSEFADIYADAKSYQASNNIYYILDVTSASLYAASYLIALRALDKPHLFGPSAIVGIVGDGFGIVSAPFSSWSYNALYKFHRKRLGKNLKEKIYDPEEIAKGEIVSLRTKVQKSNALSPRHLSHIHERLSMMDFWSCDYDDYITKTTAEDRRFSKVALQSNLSGPLISGAFLAQDIMSLVAANSFQNKPMKATTLAFISTIPPLAASGFSLLLTSYWAADEGIHHYILKKKNSTPDQLVQKRFATLNQMEGQLLKIEKE